MTDFTVPITADSRPIQVALSMAFDIVAAATWFE